jgi:Rrf2 family protein
MLRITKKAEYGIIALKHMVKQPKGEVSRAKEISQKYNIPAEIMAKILQQLARNEILRSTQGPKGGYMLANDGKNISISEIIEIFEGPFGIVECTGDTVCNCMQLPYCNIREPFRIIQEQIASFLSGISIADLNDEGEIKKMPLN